MFNRKEARDTDSRQTSLVQAEKLFGKEGILAPADAPKEFRVEDKKTPLPWSLEELKDAKRSGLTPIYRHQRGSRGPLTGEVMHTLQKKEGTQLLYNTDWYRTESFYTSEVPQEGWKLVSEEPTKGTFGKNYIQQTEVLINAHRTPSPEWELAVKEFNQKKQSIAELLRTDWRKAADAIENLAITGMTRESFSEVVQRLATRKAKSGKHALNTSWAWTRSRSSNGCFVYVGYFDGRGADVNYDLPVSTHGILGASLSRS